MIMKRTFLFLFVAFSVLLFSAGEGQGHTQKKHKKTFKTKKMHTEITTPSGLKYTDQIIGKGKSPVQGKQVTMNYTGKLTDGTKFDSNVDPKFGHVSPFQFNIGTGQVIKGWDEGIMSMKEGGKRTLVIPPGLAYGSRGAGAAVPPNATLVFDVELVKADQ